MKLTIKNMVCNRCILAVQAILQALQMHDGIVGLGTVEYPREIPQEKMKEFSRRLQAMGFEIVSDGSAAIIESIKSLLIQKIQAADMEERFSIKAFLTARVHKDYSAISRLFSQVEGITIEQFFILQKIEKVKELLFYGELTLSEIAWKLGYSSVQHLSSQFKKVTGLTPTQIKGLSNMRKPLDGIIKV